MKALKPVKGAGIRMLWYLQKATFRAGFAGFNTWDRDNLGTHSFAGGQGALAKGRSTSAFGLGTAAIGDFSFATGIFTRTLTFSSIVPITTSMMIIKLVQQWLPKNHREARFKTPLLGDCRVLLTF